MAARILLSTSGTLGDHLPFIALGKALHQRGYRVRLAVNRAMTGHSIRAGLETVALDEHEQGPGHARRYAGDWNHWDKTDDTPSLDAEAAVPMVRQLINLAGEADLLITSSIRPWGWIVREVTGVDWLTLALVPAQFYWPDDETMLPPSAVAAARAKYRDMISAVTKKLGLDHLDAKHPGFALAETVLLASSSKFSMPRIEAFQPHPPQIKTTGFIFHDDPAWQGWRPDAALEEAVRQPKKPIVLSFSSQPLEDPGAVLTLHVRAAAALGRRLIVQSGWAGFGPELLAPDVTGDGPIFAEYLPHDWLFQHAACAIQHGGIGSIARALRQGCPLLIEPYGNDQFFNALRVVSLGVGAAANPTKLTLDGLVRVLEQKVLSDVTLKNAQDFAAALQGEDGLERACQYIEARLPFRA